MVKGGECGCGLPAPLSPQTDTSRGYTKGEPRRFRHGHHARGRKHSPETRAKMARYGPAHHAWKGDDVGYSGLHQWARRSFVKADRCEDCGTEGDTEWANRGGYKRERSDWMELCRSCHRKMDGSIRNIITS